MNFYETPVREWSLRPFHKLDKEWALLTAGNEDRYNTMTVSWGTMGTLWSLPVTTVYCRSQRYTKEFLEKFDFYTLSFFGGRYMKELGYLGSNSGRDGDKVAHVGFAPLFDAETGAPYFAQASTVLICRKLYHQDLAEAHFTAPAILKEHYPTRDLHTQYVGEVLRVLER
jgi:flavin reductase (DIM6/NTAB) family NADH-FMN oxidoreductase RutF